MYGPGHVQITSQITSHVCLGHVAHGLGHVTHGSPASSSVFCVMAPNAFHCSMRRVSTVSRAPYATSVLHHTRRQYHVHYSAWRVLHRPLCQYRASARPPAQAASPAPC
eukprot:2363973-Rhodomonas_salina.1